MMGTGGFAAGTNVSIAALEAGILIRYRPRRSGVRLTVRSVPLSVPVPVSFPNV